MKSPGIIVPDDDINCPSRRPANLLAIGSITRRVLQQVAQKGFLQTSRLGVRRLADRCRELRLGIDTRGSIDGEHLGHDDNSFGYQPIPYHTIDLAIRHLEEADLGVFVDYGCGKGRAVIAAGMMPFERVIGVERSATLCAPARHNVEQARKQLRCGTIEIVQADARDFVPPSGVSVAFFFNPFDRSVLLSVLCRLHDSICQSHNSLKIIHSLPLGREDCMQECEWLQLDKDLSPNVADWERCAIYRANRFDLVS